MLSRKRPVQAAVRLHLVACLSGHETMEKIVKDIQGPGLTLVLEKLKPYGAFQDSFDSGRAVSVSVTSKGVSKLGKSTADGVAKHGNRAISGKLKSLQIVASLTAERDGEIRKAD
ncbi:Protein MICROTUBULE ORGANIZATION 1 [Trifolium repens]|nr:Protein MICROTUBULE ORGANIZATION 1 [Trifolium repens]